METLLKIVLGVAIGAVGFWALQPKPDAINKNLELEAKSTAQQEVIKSQQQTIKAVEVEPPTSSKKVDYQVLEKDKHLAPSESPKGLVLDKRHKGQSTNPPKPMETKNQFPENNSEHQYLEGIPEEYHALLAPPKPRKDLPELHRELVDEEQDLNWGLAMEQQIKSFVMNHPHSNYLLDFRVICKTTMCEIMSKVAVEHTKKWNDLCNEMIKEGWWEFSGTSSSSTYTDDKKNYINIRHITRTLKD